MIETISGPEARKVRGVDCRGCGSPEILMPVLEVDLARPLRVVVEFTGGGVAVRVPRPTVFLEDAYGAWSAMIEVACAECGEVREICRDRLLGRE